MQNENAHTDENKGSIKFHLEEKWWLKNNRERKKKRKEKKILRRAIPAPECKIKIWGMREESLGVCLYIPLCLSVCHM